jgi:hypothetical protein
VVVRETFASESGGAMRKPVSKHALRRAIEEVRSEGRMDWDEPTGTVVDRIWHHMAREALVGQRRKPVDRASVRKREPAAA